MCRFFLPRHPVSPNSTQNETAAVPYHEVLVPVFYDCCTGAEPTPSHIQSANMINKRMVLLKLNLSILNINSSPFLAMLFLIPSMPLLTNQLLISLLSAIIIPPCRSRLMKVSIKGIDHSLTSPVVVVVVADCACPLSTVYFWMSWITYMNSPHSSKNNGSTRDPRLHNNNIHTKITNFIA